MTPLNQLAKGQRIKVSNARRGAVDAEVLHVETPENLPAIDGLPEVTRVREILAERNVRQLALIEHQHSGKAVAFIAFGDGQGNWWDLQQQQLTIEAHHAAEPNR